jgi:hypothetical protein
VPLALHKLVGDRLLRNPVGHDRTSLLANDIRAGDVAATKVEAEAQAAGRVAPGRPREAGERSDGRGRQLKPPGNQAPSDHDDAGDERARIDREHVHHAHRPAARRLGTISRDG